VQEPNVSLPLGVARSWGLVEVSGRGRPASVVLADILSASIALADADGLPAVSMPRVAHRLGLTQNALYRHVASKEELLALMADEAVGPPPDLDPQLGWRTGARLWTLAVLGRYSRHPWLLDVRARAPVMRNTVTWTEAFLRVAAGSCLPVEQRLRAATLLDGHARHIASLSRDLAGQEPAYGPDHTGVLVPMLAARGLTEFASFLTAATPPTGTIGDDLTQEIDFGLECILDGLEALVARPAPPGGGAVAEGR
jgi:AcrR family transcriptional regulator